MSRTNLAIQSMSSFSLLRVNICELILNNLADKDCTIQAVTSSSDLAIAKIKAYGSHKAHGTQ